MSGAREGRGQSGAEISAGRLPVRALGRLTQILRIAARHGLGRYVKQLNLGRYLAGAHMMLESTTRLLDPKFDLFMAFQRHAPGMIMRELMPAFDPGRGMVKGYRVIGALRRA